MPRRSTKENKNIYFQSREEAGLTRAQASEATYISESRIEKIEYGQMQINPQDVVAMARAYKKPSLCNYYCANDCEIGKESVPELKFTNLSQIVLMLLNSMNRLNDEKDKLIRISADDKIDPNELSDFVSIKKQLDEISVTIETLKLWLNQMIANGDISKEQYESL
ncbi:MAG: helix-turn-helix transcriptional regulator [Eubacterium sp.]|nr:helix-turn-helix transcriptional regulator [Eubacterium sp.]